MAGFKYAAHGVDTKQVQMLLLLPSSQALIMFSGIIFQRSIYAWREVIQFRDNVGAWHSYSVMTCCLCPVLSSVITAEGF